MHLCKLTMCVDRLVYILLYNYNIIIMATGLTHYKIITWN